MSLWSASLRATNASLSRSQASQQQETTGHSHQNTSRHPASRARPMATALAKANSTQTLRSSYDTWRAFLRHRHQQVHLRRCAVALQHGNSRQEYTRLFLRWLAAAQQSAAQEAKAAFVMPKEFPLRSKKNVLSLVSRYFGKWRRHCRERWQRTETNVAVLAKANEDRLRVRVLAGWLRLHHRRRAEADTERFHGAEQHMDDLAQQLRAREKEVAILQDTMEKVTRALNGNPNDICAASTGGSETAKESLERTKALALALETAVDDFHRSVPAVKSKDSSSAAATDSVEPLSVRLRAVADSVGDVEGAKQRAEEEVHRLNELVAALLDMVTEVPTANDTTGSSKSVSANSSPVRAQQQAALEGTPQRTPRTGASSSPSRGQAASGGSRLGPRGKQAWSVQTRAAPPHAPQTPIDSNAMARANAHQMASELADRGNELPLRLLEGTERLVTGGHAAQHERELRAMEVADLRKVALRAIDSLGGRRATNEALFAAPVDDTVEESAKRSAAVVATLSELCEDLVVVLVLASLWSQDGDMEKVSESLERMWYALGQTEKKLEQEQETAEEVMQVVCGCAELLNVGEANSAREKDRLVAKAQTSAKVLADAKQLTLPRHVLDWCVALEGVKLSESREADAQRQQLEKSLDEAKRELAAAAELSSQTNAELEATKARLADAEKQLSDAQKALTARGKEAEKAQTSLSETEKRLADAEAALGALREKATQAAGAAQQALQESEARGDAREAELAEVRGELAVCGKELSDAKQALAAQSGESDKLKKKLQEADDALADAEGKLAALQEQVKRCKNGAQHALQESASREEELKAALGEAKAHLADSEKDLGDTQRTLVATQKDLDRATAQLADAEKERAACEKAAQQAAEEAEKALRESEASAEALSTALDEAKAHLADSERDLGETQRTLVATQQTLDEATAEVEALRRAFDGVAVLLSRPQSPEAHEAATKTAEHATALSSESKSTAPVDCVQLVNSLQRKLRDALENVPEFLTASVFPNPHASLEDEVAALCAWRDELLKDMHDALRINAEGEAIGAFLRDILRDVIHRLVQLRENGGDGDSMLSPRVSIALDPDDHPKPLVRGDPSQYVEYILHLEGTSEETKRAVQDHLTGGGVIGSNGGGSRPTLILSGDESIADIVPTLPSRHGSGNHAGISTPCTWDVIADVHENLAALVDMSAGQSELLLEQKEMNEQLARANGELRESLDNAQNALRNWSDRAIEMPAHTQPPSLNSSSPATGNSLVADFNAEVEAVVEALRQLKDIADEQTASLAGGKAGSPRSGEPSPSSSVRDLAALLSAMRSMRVRLVELQHSAEDGITALGGEGTSVEQQPVDGARNDASRAPQESVAERLVAICRDTGKSIEETRQILGLPSNGGAPLTLRQVLPNIKSKVSELDEVRRDSEAFVKGLDNAFNDESGSSHNSSVASTTRTHKSLKPKKKPLPALDGSPTELMHMHRVNFGSSRASRAPHSSTTTLSPQDHLNAIRLHALSKIDEVQDLRTACRAAINILDGSYTEGRKPPAYGDILVPLLLSQIEDIKKVLPQCEEVLSSGTRGAYGGRKNGVAAKLSALAAMVESLQMERDGLRGEVAGKGRQNQILLEDLEAEVHQYKKEAQIFRETTKELKEERATLQASEAALTRQLEAAEAHRKELDDETQKLDEAVRELEERLAEETALNDELSQRIAQRQHDNNVLVHALAKTLLGLAPQVAAEESSGSGEEVAAARAQSDRAPSSNEDDMVVGALVPRTVAGMEPLLLQKLAVGEGAPLSLFVQDQVDAIRHHWHSAMTGSHAEVKKLRADVEGLRHHVGSLWERELQPLCAQLLAGVEEEVELLRLENHMLRPRAREREGLLKEKVALQQQLAATEDALAAAEQETQAHVDANTALRKALSEAEVEQVIRSIPDGAVRSWSSTRQPPPVSVAELERRMIHGATSLTMEAIDAMAGENMAHTFGDVAARTVSLYHDVAQCLQDVREELRGFEQGSSTHVLATAVEKGVAGLERLSDAADQLWTHVPVLFQTPYVGSRR